MHKIKAKTFAEAYTKCLDVLINNPDYETSPRGLKINEILNAVIEIEDPTQNLFINSHRKFPVKYLAGELLWYFLGRNDLKFISKYSKFWNNIANVDGTLNSAYGHLLFKEHNEHGFNEWYWAFKSLVDDKDSRQAIIRFNKPTVSFKGNKDFVCTIYGIFHIREDELHFTIHMRSNDVWLGVTFDIPFFMILHQQMLGNLRYDYPGLKLGKYIHIANSLHMYEKNFDDAEKMVNSPIHSHGLPRLDYNLINAKGDCSNYLLDISKGIRYNGTDELLKWIDENANK